MDEANSPVSAIQGIGPGRAKLLREMGIETVLDLLRHFPRDYSDRSDIRTIDGLVPGAVNTVRGIISAEGENVSFAGKQRSALMTKIKLFDETGVLELIWFGQPYLKKFFKKGDEFVFTGRVTERFGRMQMESPEYERIGGTAGDSAARGQIVPVYTLPKGISQKMFRGYIKAALDKISESAFSKETLPGGIREEYKLCGRGEAVRNIHFPGSDGDFYKARRRLVFEELFTAQLALLRVKGNVKAQPGIRIEGADVIGEFLSGLPFRMTQAQSRVLDELLSDMSGGTRMNRLVQGDVGSGKTAVAAAAAYAVIQSGYQAAIMAPTEVLARQHLRSFTKFLNGINTVLLTGGLTKKEHTAALESIRSGAAQMIVGTHALIQNGVEFNSLALVITDEQHRFGVRQRAALAAKNIKAPHTLVMTATPIPRTLGLILYGDMDISVIDELPPGRVEIKTYKVNSGYRSRLQAFIAKLVREGRQAYIVCPAIEENGNSVQSGAHEVPLAAVKKYAAQLQADLPEISTAFLHGRMTETEKEAIMGAFGRNEISVLVSTTVVEVGVDVPNAVLMIVENADRFGLSQLHQLRGRVGRGGEQSYCVLVTDTKNAHTLERMRAMEKNSDGFALSELDLKLRGTGDFFGTQQHGLPSFSIANLYRDIEILKEAQAAAVRIYEKNTGLLTDIPFDDKLSAKFFGVM